MAEPLTPTPADPVFDHTAAPPPEEDDSYLAELEEAREALNADQRQDFPIPGFRGHLWATYRLPKSGQGFRWLRTLMDDTTSDARLDKTAAEFLAHCTVGVWRRQPDGTRRDFGGHDEDNPGGWDALPAVLVPPRPAHRPHTDATRILALFNGRGDLVVTHAATVAGWANEALADAGAQFEGESGGGES